MMGWTFEEIARRWNEIIEKLTFMKSVTLVEEARKRLLPPFLQALTGSERGWFKACYTWAQGGSSPGVYPEQMLQVLTAMDAYRRMIAEVHLECARAVRDVLAPESQWTSMPPLSQAQLTHLHELLAAIPARFPALPPPLGRAFLCDLADELLDRPRRAKSRRLALFPLVWKVKRDGEEAETGFLAQFVLEGLPGGSGEVFLAPEQAFTPMDESFSRVFTDAPQALRALHLCQPGCDVRVRIEKWHQSDSREDALIHSPPLMGGSGGGALALRLWSVWTGIPLEPGVVTSFALTDPDAEEGKRPDGGCYRIGGDLLKARTIAEEKGGDGIFLVSQTQGGELDDRAGQMRLLLKRAEGLSQAIEASVGVGRYIHRRIQALEPVDPRKSRNTYSPLLYTPLTGSYQVPLLLYEPATPGTGTPEREWRRESVKDLRELLRRRGNFVLVGDPGGGKTFTLKAVERLAFEEYISGSSKRLPVFLPLNKWKTAERCAPEEGLKRFVCEQVQELEPVFDAYFKAGRFLFLCDALNEMPEYRTNSPETEILKTWIRNFGETEESDESAVAPAETPRCRFFFTCRTENYQTSLPARRVDIARLDEAGIVEMAHCYLRAFDKEAGVDGFLQALRDNDVLDLCKNPMLLGMFAFLYARGSPSWSSGRFPHSRGALFQGVCEDLFEHEETGQNLFLEHLSRQTVEAGLRALGFSLLRERSLTKTEGPAADDGARGFLTVHKPAPGDFGVRTDGNLTREEAACMMAPALGSRADEDRILDADAMLDTKQLLEAAQLRKEAQQSRANRVLGGRAQHVVPGDKPGRTRPFFWGPGSFQSSPLAGILDSASGSSSAVAGRSAVHSGRLGAFPESSLAQAGLAESSASWVRRIRAPSSSSSHRLGGTITPAGRIPLSSRRFRP